MSRGRRAVERAQPGKPPLSAVRRIISSLRLFPKTPDFFAYFERSSENIVKGTELLCRMVKNPGERHALVEQLKDIEHVGIISRTRSSTSCTPPSSRPSTGWTSTPSREDGRRPRHRLLRRQPDDPLQHHGDAERARGLGRDPPPLLGGDQQGDAAPAPHEERAADLEHCIEINRLENEATRRSTW